MSSQEKIAECRIEFGFCQEHQSGEVRDQPMGYCEEWAIHRPRRAPSEREKAVEKVIEAAKHTLHFLKSPASKVKDHPALEIETDRLSRALAALSGKEGKI